jgi:hypothetical protein
MSKILRSAAWQRKEGKNPSGGKMRKPGSPGAPTNKAIKESQS